jgi:hypothetical protein
MGNAATPGQEQYTSAAHGTGSISEAAESIKERGHAAWDDAKDATRSRLNEQKDATAEGIRDVAGTLRDAARASEGEHEGLARLTRSAAEGLERVSGTLRNKDVGTMLRDLESFAREQPVALFGIALAVGFLAVRFTKSSEPQDQEHSWT